MVPKSSGIALPAGQITGRACRVHAFGPPEVISVEDVVLQPPSMGEVLVQVKVAGVGPWDAWICAGKSALPQPLPLTLGSDPSGVVAAVGPGVKHLAARDPVFGVTNPGFIGSYAEYAIASAAMLARKPAALGDIDAAAIPVVAVTAWQALFEHARVSRGDTIVVHGAAGSVGAFVVQLAHNAGVRVIATASGRDLAYVRGCGADEAIGVGAQRFENAVRDADAVIDLVGGELQTRSFAVLRSGGALVSAVSPPDQALANCRGVRALFFLVDVTTERLAELASMIENGSLKAAIGTVLPLSAARAAHEMLEGRWTKPRGKIVLRVTNDGVD
jgi:NADPH:quinone reductase-like Zn-dependent oxidoreductase